MGKSINVISIMSVLLFHMVFVHIYLLGSAYNYIVYGCMFFLGLFLLLNYKIIFKSQKFRWINVLLFSFGIINIISSFQAGTILKGIVFFGKVIESFLFFEFIYLKSMKQKIISIFLFCTAGYSLLTILFILILPKGVDAASNYLIGNKFEVCYNFIFLVVLYACKNYRQLKKGNKKLTIFCALVIASVFVSFLLNCNTALIGNVILIAILFINRGGKRALKWHHVTILLMVVLIFGLFNESITRNIVFQNFVKNVLHRDVTLTGRTIIYSKMLPIISERILFGYGYGNSYVLLIERIGAANSQNGIFECLINYGITGFLIELGIVYVACRQKYNEEAIPLLGMIYMYLFLATVEITLGLGFLCYISFVLLFIKESCSYEKNRNYYAYR